MNFMHVIVLICVGAPCQNYGRRRRVALAAARRVLASHLITKTSPVGCESTDHDTASSSANTAGHHRRSQRKSVKCTFSPPPPACQVIAQQAAAMLVD